MFDTNVFVVKEVENKNHRNSKMLSQECVTFKKKYKVSEETQNKISLPYPILPRM